MVATVFTNAKPTTAAINQRAALASRNKRGSSGLIIASQKKKLGVTKVTPNKFTPNERLVRASRDVCAGDALAEHPVGPTLI